MKNDQEHFIKCETCGGMIDCRDLSQVFEHEHKEDSPINPKALKGIRSKKVGDPVDWKDGKPTHLN